MAGSCTSHELSDRDKFGRFFRTVAPDTAIVPARFKLMEEFQWTKFASAHEPAKLFTTVRSLLLMPQHILPFSIQLHHIFNSLSNAFLSYQME